MLHTKSMFNCWKQHLHGRYQSLVIINTIKKHPKNKNEHHLPKKKKTKLSKSRNVMIKNKETVSKNKWIVVLPFDYLKWTLDSAHLASQYYLQMSVKTRLKNLCFLAQLHLMQQGKYCHSHPLQVLIIYVHQTCSLIGNHLILQVACTPSKESNFLCIVSHTHPFELGLCVRLSNLSLQNHLTPYISYSYHHCIVYKLPILQPLIT